MKITFLGATRTVTGSNILVETKTKKFIMDCGLYQGQQKEIMLNSDSFYLILLKLILFYYHMHILTIQEEFPNYMLMDTEAQFMLLKQLVIFVK